MYLLSCIVNKYIINKYIFFTLLAKFKSYFKILYNAKNSQYFKETFLAKFSSISLFHGLNMFKNLEYS